MALRPGAAAAACVLLSCTAQVGPEQDTPDDEDVGETAQALSRVIHEDFESDAQGPLTAPWSLVTASTGSSTSARVVRLAHHGNVLRVMADARTTDFLIATLGFWSPQHELRAQLDVEPIGRAAFVCSVNGSGASIAKRRIRLQRAPGSTALVASTAPGGNTRCGTLPSNAWTTLALRVHAAQLPHTFDVLIDGKPSACMGLQTGLSAPFRSVTVMDASNAGWGGEVRFDDVTVTAAQ